MAKAKKSNLFPIIACTILLLTAILTISMLATPLFSSDSMPEDAKQSAFEYVEEMNEKSEITEKSGIEMAKEALKEAEEALAKAKDAGLPTEKLEQALTQAKQPVVLYDSLVAAIAISAIAIAVAAVALVLAVLKKNKLAFIIGFVAAVLLLATFAAACAATAACNSIINDAEGVVVVAPIVALVISLIGSLAGGGLLVLKRK